jgi:hypothetical protein
MAPQGALNQAVGLRKIAAHRAGAYACALFYPLFETPA